MFICWSEMNILPSLSRERGKKEEAGSLSDITVSWMTIIWWGKKTPIFISDKKISLVQ